MHSRPSRCPSRFAERRAAGALALALGAAWAAALPSRGLAQPTAGSNLRVEEHTMAIGEQLIIPAEGVRNYSEGVQGIVDVRLARDGSRFVVLAERAGTTTLLLILNDGSQVQHRFTVGSPDQARPPDEVAPRENIRLDFYFIQLDETYQHRIGVHWPDSYGPGTADEINLEFDFLYEEVTNATANITIAPLPRLDLMQTNGWARMVRQSAVITANRTPARFQSGGEVNVPVGGVGGGDLKQIFYGSNVSVEPRYDPNTRRIELHIAAEVSELTAGRGTDLPGRKLSELESVVNLELGQAVMLGGLIAESSLRANTGLPGLSQIPILGVLFGTHASQSEATQNVLFIVPTVIDSVEPDARELIREALGVYREYGGAIDEVELMRMPAGVPSAAEPEAQRRPAPARAAPTSGQGGAGAAASPPASSGARTGNGS